MLLAAGGPGNWLKARTNLASTGQPLKGVCRGEVLATVESFPKLPLAQMSGWTVEYLPATKKEQVIILPLSVFGFRAW